MRQALLAGLALLLSCNAQATGDPSAGPPVDDGPAAVANQAGASMAVPGVMPDGYRQATDGADDAPSLQRAVDSICANRLPTRTLQLRARHYDLRTPITQPCQVHWIGQGFQEQASGPQAAMTGTWLDIGIGAFGPDGTRPAIMIAGVAASGSVLQGFGLTQPVALPAPAEPGWTPADTPFLVAADGVSGLVTFRNLHCYGVNRCLSSHLAGRTVMEDIRGQAWRTLLRIDKAFDQVRIDRIHVWPFYSQNNAVIAFQQANAVAVHSLRNDTPAIGSIFVFGMRDGLLLDHGAAENPGTIPAGTTTGGVIGDLSCDFVVHCLRVAPTAAGVTMRIGNLRAFGQAWPVAPFAYLVGSDVISVEGSAVLQVGTVDNFGTGGTAIRLANAEAKSIVHVGSYYGRTNDLPPGWTLTSLAKGAGHQVIFAIPPAFGSALPAGYASKNTSTDGTVSWPTMEPR